MKNNSGYTLVETLIAITILGIGLLAVAGLQATSIQHNANSQLRTYASIVAQNVTEDLLGRSYSDPLLTDIDADGDNGLSEFGFDNNDATQDDADYQRTIFVKGLPYTVFWNVSEDSPVQNSKRFRILVQWQERGRTRTINFTHTKVL